MSVFIFQICREMATTLSASLISAAAVATSAYLNAKLSISIDFQQLSYDRAWRNRLGERIQQLGDTCTLYHMFDLVNSNVEALWFEGRIWTYGELKRGELSSNHFFLEPVN